MAVGVCREGALAASPPGYTSVGRVLLRMRVLRALACCQACAHMWSAAVTSGAVAAEGLWLLGRGWTLVWHWLGSDVSTSVCGPWWLNSAERFNGEMPVALGDGEA